MEAGRGYNGWANYPTWAVHLWFSNRRALHEAARAQVALACEPGDSAARLHDWVAANSPIQTGSMFYDLLSWALREVDWESVARALAPAEPDDEASSPSQGRENSG